MLARRTVNAAVTAARNTAGRAVAGRVIQRSTHQVRTPLALSGLLQHRSLPLARCYTRAGQRRFCSGVVQPNLRNISVIAHVDHGKTTLVDAMLQQSTTPKEHKGHGNRVMDSHELEAERGITILAKNTSISLGDKTINIVDTPGHADFSGEVERALQMVEGFILLVDAAEGPKPGTRYVLQKALELDLKPVVVINKVDRSSPGDIDETKDKIESLFLELAVNDDQLDYPVVYGSGKNGYMNVDQDKREGTLEPLWDTVLKHIPAPAPKRDDGGLQLLVTSVDFDDRGKRLAVGRIYSGKLETKGEAFITDYHVGEGMSSGSFKVTELLKYQGVSKVTTQSATVGDIVCIRTENLDKTGVKIGHTLCQKNMFNPLYYKPLDEPTFAVTMHPNRSPVAGKEGTKNGGPEIRERLTQEAVKNLAMKIEILGPDEFKIMGRGLLHLGVLFEEMRRQGFEFELSRPTVSLKEVDGKKMEPWEQLTLRCKTDYVGDASTILYASHADLKSQKDLDGDNVETVWDVPVRCMLGLGPKIKNACMNQADIEQEFAGYRPFDTSISTRREQGSLLSSGDGEVSTDGLGSVAKHGVSFVSEKMKTYRDMIVGTRGAAAKNGDLEINVTKPSSGWSKGSGAPVYQVPTLETALGYIQEDEFVELTPTAVRMRKKPRSDKERKLSLRG